MIRVAFALVALTGCARAQQQQQEMPPPFRAMHERVRQEVDNNIMCNTQLIVAQDQIAKLTKEIEELKAKK